jgi:hypothetical protein
MNEYEIVGLYKESNGRSCERHRVCGEVVKIGDILRMKQCVTEYNGKTKEAIKFVSIVNGYECCTVGFLPQYLVSRATAEGCNNRFVEVLKLYNKSTNTFERRKSHNSKDMALCRHIADIEGILSVE